MLKLFLTFFKIGLFTFGGGYAMIPLINEEIANFDIDPYTFTDFIAISESTPGPFAINIATFIGYNSYGILGSIIATTGVILPSFIVIILLAIIYNKIKNTSFFKTVMGTLTPVVLGLILSSLLKITSFNLFSISDFLNIHNEFDINIITLITFLILIPIVIIYYIIKKKRLSPFIIIIISLICGASSYLFFL